MDSSFIGSISQLPLFGLLLLFLFFLSSLLILFLKRYELFFFLLILSASFIGSDIQFLAVISPLIRWLMVGYILIIAFTGRIYKVIPGFYSFWTYIIFGFIFLIFSINFSWQIQRSILLAIVSISIPLSISSFSFKKKKKVVENISYASSIYSLTNIFLISKYLNEASRYSGTSRGAPAFALFLGALLPFSFWGIWNLKSKIGKFLSIIGFISGFITLAFTGQRTGTISGLISLIPMILFLFRGKHFKKPFFATILVFLGSMIFLYMLTPSKLLFLQSRYSLNSGLSNRDIIWKFVLEEKLTNIFLGHGIGASEQVIASSFHNGFLEILFNAGIVGLLFYLFSLVYFGVTSFNKSLFARNLEERALSNLAFSYIIGFTFSNIFESIGASASSLNILLFLIMCSMIPLDFKKSESKQDQQIQSNACGVN